MNVLPSPRTTIEMILEIDEQRIIKDFMNKENLHPIPPIHLLLLRKLMEETGTTQREIALILEVKQATISRWLNGKRRIESGQCSLIFLRLAFFFAERTGLDEEAAFRLCKFLLDGYSRHLMGSYFLVCWAKEHRQILEADSIIEEMRS